MRRPYLAPLLLAAGALLAPAAAHAQLPASEAWSSIESTHFRVTYTRPLEPLARHAAAAAERARSALLEYLADAPGERVDVVLSDNVDITNGSATPFPGNRIYIYVKPPVDMPELSYMEDWLELVVAHELAHVFHLDATSRFGRALRAVFGRVPSSWPLFPALGSPGWSLEGLAVVVESALTPLGRVHGTYHDMVARTAALEDRIDDIDRLSSDSPLWPGGQRVYSYGSLFLHDLEQRHGADVLGRVVRRTASATIPPALWYDRIGSDVLGVPFRRAYDEWRARATARYRALADTLARTGVTETTVLAARGGIAGDPRFSPDGRWIVYTAHDRRSTPELRVIDSATGQEAWAKRTNGSAGAAWLPDGTLIAPWLEFRDAEHIYYDLYRIAPGDADRLTRSARLQDVDATRDGTRLVAVENRAGTNRLVLLDAQGRSLRPITAFAAGVHWSGPRWSPDGTRLAASRWSEGGRFDVVVLDTAGTLIEQVTSGIGVNTDPAWTPDGRYLVFSSDRTGIANLYAYDLERDALHQLTSVLTGAFAPDVSPDGRRIVFSAYHADGYRIETTSFDFPPRSAPAAARLPQLPAALAPRAPAATDTLAGPPRRYRAWRHTLPQYWAPQYLELESGRFLGFTTGGADLVGRHVWDAGVAADFSSGRSTGTAGYSYRGLPPVAGNSFALSLRGVRTWDRILEAAAPGDPIIDEREDVLSAQLSLLRPRWRSSGSIGIAGELAQRRRRLTDAPGRRLRDEADDLLGLRISGTFGNARSYPFSISAEDGVRLQLSARQRWDRDPSSFTDEQGTVITFDGGYRELVAWSAAYRALGRAGFANAVLALRASALWRDGPGASTHGVGGSSGGGIAGVESQFLPVRGFASSTRRGLRAWSSSAELRVPLALIAAKPRPLPFFLHSLSAALFADAGNADCPASRSCGPRADGPLLLASGAELGLDASLLGFRSRFRFGAGLPLQGSDARKPRFYLQLGSAF